MAAIAIYILGLLTPPAMALVLVVPTELFRKDARWCPYCMGWLTGTRSRIRISGRLERNDP